MRKKGRVGNGLRVKVGDVTKADLKVALHKSVPAKQVNLGDNTRQLLSRVPLPGNASARNNHTVLLHPLKGPLVRVGRVGRRRRRLQSLDLESPEPRVQLVVLRRRVLDKQLEVDAVNQPGVELVHGHGRHNVAVKADRVDAELGLRLRGGAEIAAPHNHDADDLHHAVRRVLVLVQGVFAVRERGVHRIRFL